VLEISSNAVIYPQISDRRWNDDLRLFPGMQFRDLKFFEIRYEFGHDALYVCIPQESAVSPHGAASLQMRLLSGAALTPPPLP
jgi:hypothetical protein